MKVILPRGGRRYHHHEMAHGYISSLFHVVFSTKQRIRSIDAELQRRLWSYLAAIARNHGVRVLAVGGTKNHVHILLFLRAEQNLAEIVRTLKCNSSRWIHQTQPLFYWQEGYGAFSVSPSQVDGVTRYIANQAEHHRRRSFEEEFIAMLRAAKVPFEPDQLFG